MADLRRPAVVWLLSQALWACHWVFPFNVGDAGRDLPVGDARFDRPIGDARSDLRLATPDGPLVNLDLLDLSVGAAHTCAINRSGDLYCWGWNEWGQLGVGDTESVAKPAKVLKLVGVTAVSAGVNHTCALAQQQVYCWGHNGNGHLGIGTQTSTVAPKLVAGLTGVVQIATGNFHTCARTAKGEVWCWGANSHGEVGIPNTSTNTNITTPQKVNFPSAASAASQIALGYFHSCARCGGEVYCWGQNDAGQLGDGSTINRSTPTKVSNLADATGVWAGVRSTCVVRKSGEASCWGWNSHGQVDATDVGSNRTLATSVRSDAKTKLGGVIELAPGERHTCALVNPGRKVLCWGSNLLGQLGDGGASDTPFPHEALGITNAIRLSGVSRTTCALLQKGIKCWGSRGRGQIGDGENGYVLTPVKVVGLPSKAVALDAGERHTCAVLDDNSTWCWGDNASGQCGSDAKSYLLPGPTQVTFPATTPPVAASVVTGTAHSCVATTTSQALCWGANESGQLGDGTEVSRYTPAPVRAGSTNCTNGQLFSAVAVTAGERHTCLRSPSNKVYCVGGNGSGQLGQDPKLVASSPCPIEVGLIAEVIAAADGTSCALVGGSSTLRCWGAGAFDSFPLTGKGSGLSLGRNHGCLVVGGEASCWGSGGSGQLGTNSTQNLTAPSTPVVDNNNMPLKDVFDVSASPGMGWTGAHSCAAAKGGTYCWGWNAYGQLGDGTWKPRLNAGMPILADGKALSATKVATGPHHSCAISTTGLVWCWGYNGGGAVGSGADTLPVARTPTSVSGL